MTACDATGRTWRRSATVTAGGMAGVPKPLPLPPRSGGWASRAPTASPIIYGSSPAPDTCSSASADRQLSGLPRRHFGHRATLLLAASPRRRCSSHYELTAEPREGGDLLPGHLPATSYHPGAATRRRRLPHPGVGRSGSGGAPCHDDLGLLYLRPAGALTWLRAMQPGAPGAALRPSLLVAWRPSRYRFCSRRGLVDGPHALLRLHLSSTGRA